MASLFLLERQRCAISCFWFLWSTQNVQILLGLLLMDVLIPACPVCLERLDLDRSGILTTLCDHSFQCPCVSKWTYLSCQVTCRLLGVILEESSPKELQKQATVKSTVLEVITKFCDLYLMELVLDDESEKRVLVALEEAGVFTSGGLVKDKVLFCSTCYHLLVEASEVTWLEETQPPENLMVKRGQYIGPTIRRR